MLQTCGKLLRCNVPNNIKSPITINPLITTLPTSNPSREMLVVTLTGTRTILVYNQQTLTDISSTLIHILYISRTHLMYINENVSCTLMVQYLHLQHSTHVRNTFMNLFYLGIRSDISKHFYWNELCTSIAQRLQITFTRLVHHPYHTRKLPRTNSAPKSNRTRGAAAGSTTFRSPRRPDYISLIFYPIRNRNPWNFSS
jgi:hypothetical protein